jgi:hypothetical protein
MSTYIVKALKFVCGDESGMDWLGSDRPYWVFTTKVDGKVRTSRSPVFEDVDSGDSRRFNESRTVWPAKDSKVGAEGPIALSVQLWEHDQGNVDDVAAATEKALTLAGVVSASAWVAAAGKVVSEALISLFGDDLMGSQTLLWSGDRLKRLLPEPGHSFTQKYHFGGNDGDLPFNIAGGPDYDLYLQVTRLT